MRQGLVILLFLFALSVLSAADSRAMDYREGDRESTKVIDRRQRDDRMPKHGEVGQAALVFFAGKISDYLYGYNQMIIDGDSLYANPQATSRPPKGATAKDCAPHVRPLLPSGKALAQRLEPKQDPDVLLTPKGETAKRLFSLSSPPADACNQQFVDDINWRIGQLVKIRKSFERLYGPEAGAANKIAEFTRKFLAAANKPSSPAFKCADRIRTFRYKAIGLYTGYRDAVKELKQAESELAELAKGASCPEGPSNSNLGPSK